MIELAIDSGREAEPLKTDKQYQYSCLLLAFSADVTDPIVFVCLSLSTDLVGNPDGGHTLIPPQFLRAHIFNSSTANFSCVGECYGAY